MDVKIITRCSTLKITEEEIVDFDIIASNKANLNIDMAIVGKVMTMGPYNLKLLSGL